MTADHIDHRTTRRTVFKTAMTYDEIINAGHFEFIIIPCCIHIPPMTAFDDDVMRRCVVCSFIINVHTVTGLSFKDKTFDTYIGRV